MRVIPLTTQFLKVLIDGFSRDPAIWPLRRDAREIRKSIGDMRQKDLRDIERIFTPNICNKNQPCSSRPLPTSTPASVDPSRRPIIEFRDQWRSEACSLKTPHWQVGDKLLNHLLDPGIEFAIVEPYSKTNLLFEKIPTVEDLINDVRHAEKKRKLKLIDSRSSKPDGISEHSAENLLNCISSVENKTFHAGSVHYSTADVAASPTGVGACGAKPLPLNLLTMSGIIPKGSPILHSSDL